MEFALQHARSATSVGSRQKHKPLLPARRKTLININVRALDGQRHLIRPAPPRVFLPAAATLRRQCFWLAGDGRCKWRWFEVMLERVGRIARRSRSHSIALCPRALFNANHDGKYYCFPAGRHFPVAARRRINEAWCDAHGYLYGRAPHIWAWHVGRRGQYLLSGCKNWCTYTVPLLFIDRRNVARLRGDCLGYTTLPRLPLLTLSLWRRRGLAVELRLEEHSLETTSSTVTKRPRATWWSQVRGAVDPVDFVLPLWIIVINCDKFGISVSVCVRVCRKYQK